jgi:hypothetical protein
MKAVDIPRMRLVRQGIARPVSGKPEDVVSWFGAVQAQDYLGSLWAIGLRTRGATQSTVEDAERRRAIVRLWPMRGTLHFVAAQDARWMTRLLAPRVIARHAARWKRDFGVDARLLARADETISRALEGGRRLDREHIYECLEARRIRTADSRGLHILQCLALRGRICLAGRQGKQHTFALLDEWIPDPRELAGDEAFAELASRYFASHGPATLKDFMWWAGITAKDAAAAIAAIGAAGAALETAAVDGVRFWWRDPAIRRIATPVKPVVRLLPAFDEFTVAYQDRSLLVEGHAPAAKMSLLSPAVLVDGRVVGTWKRKLSGRGALLTQRLFRKLTRDESKALREAEQHYAGFLDCDAAGG